jgi:hypothetical protein
MTTQRFKIKTLEKSKGPLVEFNKEIMFSDNGLIIKKDVNNLTIDIHSIEINEGEDKLVRDFSSKIVIKLFPEWIDENSKKNLNKLIHQDEILEKTVVMYAYIYCPSLKKILDIKKVNISVIDNNFPIIFNDIELKNIEGKLIVSSNISRIKSHSDTDLLIADKKNSILCQNDDISIYVDEVDKPGGDYLNIQPEALGKLLFKMSDWTKKESDSPKLFYDSSFEKFIKGGDYYNSVQIFLMMSLIIYSENCLKWYLFGNNFNENDDYHNSIKDYLAKILNIKKNELNEIQSLDENQKIKKYIEISKLLNENIQISTISYKSMFKKFIDEELKFKK